MEVSHNFQTIKHRQQLCHVRGANFHRFEKKKDNLATMVMKEAVNRCSARVSLRAPINIQLNPSQIVKMLMIGGKQLQKLVGGLKSKLMRPLKSKNPYDKMDKTESMRVEIKSRKAQKLIAETLLIADSLGRKSYSF